MTEKELQAFLDWIRYTKKIALCAFVARREHGSAYEPVPILASQLIQEYLHQQQRQDGSWYSSIGYNYRIVDGNFRIERVGGACRALNTIFEDKKTYLDDWFADFGASLLFSDDEEVIALQLSGKSVWQDDALITTLLRMLASWIVPGSWLLFESPDGIPVRVSFNGTREMKMEKE